MHPTYNKHFIQKWDLISARLNQSNLFFQTHFPHIVYPDLLKKSKSDDWTKSSEFINQAINQLIWRHYDNA